MTTKAFGIWWYLVLAGLFLHMHIGLSYGSAEHPIGMALCIAPVFALVVFLLVSAIAKYSRRRLHSGDVWRIICWTVAAYAEGVRQMADGYYRVLFPAYADYWTAGALAMICLAFLGIVVSLLIRPPSKRYRAGECRSCGCIIADQTLGSCPECGSVIGSSTS